jgi:hypothetical protein
LCAAALAKLQAAYQAYSDSCYSLAWQSSAREFRDTAKDLAGSATAAEEQKQAAKAILEGLTALKGRLFKGIMVYYGSKAAEIKAADEDKALDAVTWDFNTLDTNDPQVSITDELYPLLMVAIGEPGTVLKPDEPLWKTSMAKPCRGRFSPPSFSPDPAPDPPPPFLRPPVRPAIGLAAPTPPPRGMIS